MEDIWVAAGRPGAAKLRDAARRAGLGTTLKEAQAFVKAQAISQVFAKAPASNGRIVAPQANSRWQVDLIDFKSNPDQGNTVVLVAIDVFSRELWAEALPPKSADVVAAAFGRMLGKGSRRGAKGPGESPKEVSHDAGTEWSGPFAALLESRGIVSTQKTSRNSLAIVDAAIKGLKDTMKKDTGSWVEALPRAVAAHNSGSHSGLMGSRPVDVKKNPELQYTLEAEAGRAMAHNADIHEGRLQTLKAAGAFRTQLPKSTWSRAGHPRWSGEVHQVKHFNGGDVVATDGTRVPAREALAVDKASKNVVLPANPSRVSTGAAEALKPFAAALEGFLGTGSLTLQGAGTKLRGLPGFAEAMKAQKLTGIGALLRFVALTS